MLKAKELNITPEELVTKVRAEHMATYAAYDINFTNYHTTHSEENKKFSEIIYKSALDNDLIIKKSVNQYYDETEGMFLSDRFIQGTCPKCSAEKQYGDGCEVCGATYEPRDLINPLSTLSNSTPILKDSEHIFFDLPQKASMLKSFLEKVNIQSSIKNKLNEWLEDLKPWDISRDAPYFGFEIPNEKDKYFYVWLDAPIGYIASIDNWASDNNMTINDYWSNNSEYEIVHFIGKDIAYFHGLFWPALLDSADLKLPDGIYVHGFLTINGEKMSKSKGTGILAREFAEVCDPETLRYYFAAKLNDKVEDIDLNLEDYVTRINSDLVGKYCNIASRCSSFIKKNDNKLSDNINNELIESIKLKKPLVTSHYNSRNYSKAVRLIMEMADDINKYINDSTPWKKELNEAVDISSSALNAFRLLSIYLQPIIPNITKNAFKFLNSTENSFEDLGKMLNKPINNYVPLLNRLEPINLKKDEPMDDNNFIDIKQFADVDLRVAQIIEASLVEGADKLLKLNLNVGELGERQVFAGIKKAYDPEELTDRLVILVSNLEPRQMKFGLSEGMVLASSDDEGIYLISPDTGAKPGLRVK